MRQKSRGRVVKVCPVCQAVFLVKASHADKSTYCSRPCMASAYQSRLRGQSNPHYTAADRRVCLHCATSYRSYHKTRRFCSLECARAAKFLLGTERRQIRAAEKAAKADSARARAIARSRLCLSCGGLSGKYHWCMTCRLHGKHLKPPRTSTCSTCSVTVNRPNRKYCARCWSEWMSATRATPRRTDANQAEIVDALRKVGCSVMDLSHVGRGCPDILVSDRQQRLHLMEIKTAKGKLNKRQQEWHDKWQGPRPFVVRTVEEALAAIGIGVSV